MTNRIDLSLVNDRRDVIHQIVETLVGGGVARLACDRGQCLLALATHPVATRRLASVKARQSSALMVAGAQAAADFVPTLSARASRLLNRTRTPTHLEFPDGVDGQILEELQPDAAFLVSSDGALRLTVPVDDMARGVIRLLPGPAIVLVPKEESAASDVAELEVGVMSHRQPCPPAIIHFRGDEWTLVESGSLSGEDVVRLVAERIVFVCTGNTCRSPMAEGVFRKLLAERLACDPGELLQQGFDIVSAGVSATVGAPASPDSVAVCASHGVDLRRHASQPLQQVLLEHPDRLYTMTAGHRDAILNQFPEYSRRVRLLSRVGLDVMDPIGSGRAAYEQCFAEIAENLHSLVDEVAVPAR